MSYPIQSFFDYDFEEPSNPALRDLYVPEDHFCKLVCKTHQLLYHPLSDDVPTGQLGVLVPQGHLRHIPVDRNTVGHLGLCFGVFPIPGKCETKILDTEPLTDATALPKDAAPPEVKDDVPPETKDTVSSRTRHAATRKHKVTIKVEDTEEQPRGLSPASTVRVRVPRVVPKSREEELKEQSNYGWDGVSRGISRMEATAIMEARQQEKQRGRSRETGAGIFTNSEVSKMDDNGIKKEPEDHRSAVERRTKVGQVKPGKR